MTIFGLVIVTFVAFLEALASSILWGLFFSVLSHPLTLIGSRIFRLYASSFRYRLTSLFNILLLGLFLRFFSSLNIFFGVPLSFSVLYSSKSGLIGVFLPDILSIDCKSLIMNLFNMVQILRIRDKVTLIFIGLA